MGEGKLIVLDAKTLRAAMESEQQSGTVTAEDVKRIIKRLTGNQIDAEILEKTQQDAVHRITAFLNNQQLSEEDKKEAIKPHLKLFNISYV